MRDLNLKPKLLITGGGGFIGSHLAETLSNRYEIILYDNFQRNSLRYVDSLKEKVTVIDGDVLDVNALERAMNGVTAVLHLAAIAGVSSYYSQAARTLEVNVLGTVNVIEAMRRTGVKSLIDFSTSEVYGSMAENVTEESLHQIGPVSEKRWVYAVSKLASEHFVLRNGEERGWLTSCVRPFNIYGPRQTGEGAISNFCRDLLVGKPLTIYGDGTDARAWCYVSDMVEAVTRILERPQAAGKTYNIGNPVQVVTTTELAQMLIKINGRGEIRYVEATHTPIRFRSPNINRAKQVLGFEPKVGLEKGLRETLNWFRDVGA